MTTQRMDILAVGMTTPVGLSAQATAAAVRAGITRTRESTVHLSAWDGQRLGLVDERHLHPLAPALETSAMGLSDRHRRMLRLSTLAFRELLTAWKPPTPPPLMLALPEPPPQGMMDPVGPGFLSHLSQQTGVGFDAKSSRVFRQGRAGGLLALETALALLTSRQVDCVYVGGVDTYLDLSLLGWLDAQERLLSEGRAEGFIPGEGAAFLLLTTPKRTQSLGLEPLAQLMGTGTGKEKGHLYSDSPHLGEGLTDSLHALFTAVPREFPKVETVYAGMTGERIWGREWGIAYLRNRDRIQETYRIEHPAEYLGDPGAALGTLMVGLSALALRKGYRKGPCLVWCGSDREARGAALVHSA